MQGNKFGQKKFQKPIPVKEGETYEVTIESIGAKGDGIAKVDGYVIIVPKTQKGQKVKIKINAIRGKVSFGEIVEDLGGGEAEEEKSQEESEEQEDSTQEEEESEEESYSEDEPEEESEDDEKQE